MLYVGKAVSKLKFMLKFADHTKLFLYVLEVGLILINYDMKFERNYRGAGRKFFQQPHTCFLVLHSPGHINISF